MSVRQLRLGLVGGAGRCFPFLTLDEMHLVGKRSCGCTQDVFGMCPLGVTFRFSQFAPFASKFVRSCL